MLPSFVKRLSDSLPFGKKNSSSDDRGDNNAEQLRRSTSRHGNKEEGEEMLVLRRQATHELVHDGEEAILRRSSRTQAVVSVRQATKQLSRKTSTSMSVHSMDGITSNEVRKSSVEQTVSRSSSKAHTRNGVSSELSRPSLRSNKTGSLSEKMSSTSETGSLSKKASSASKTGSLSKKASLASKTGSLSKKASSASKTGSLSKKASSASKTGSLSKKASSASKTGSLSKKASSASKTGSLSKKASSASKTGSLSKKASSASNEHEGSKTRSVSGLRKSATSFRGNLSQPSPSHQDSPSNQDSPSHQDSPSNQDNSGKTTSEKLKKKRQKQQWFPRGVFLAIKADDSDSFYLCRSLRTVYSFMKEVPIRWLIKKKKPVKSVKSVKVNEYHLGYKDTVETYSILMEVNLTSVSRTHFVLPDDELKEINRLLDLSDDVEKGKISLAELNDDVEPIILTEEPPPKKPRLKKTASQKLRDKEAVLAKKQQRSPTAGEKRKRASKPKGESEPKRRKVSKSKAELQLHPRPDIKVLEKDPLFETSEDVPYISKVANSRLIYRAINLQDNELLRKLLTDGNFICRLYTKSVDSGDDPLTEALKFKDINVAETIVKEYEGHEFSNRMKNNEQEANMLNKLDTGRYNDRSLGIPFIRQIAASRGCREGNNAFLKDETVVSKCFMTQALARSPCDEAHLNALIDRNKEFFFDWGLKINDVPDLLLAGKNEIAGRIMGRGEDNTENNYFRQRRGRKRGFYTSIFSDVLLFKNEDLTHCPPSVVKQVLFKDIIKLSVFHCAAANPNSKYLEKLLSVQSDVHIADKYGRTPIHYAAGCSSTANLKVLLEWGANPYQTDRNRKIPLHYAVEANRPDNVQLLLEDTKKRTDGQLAKKSGQGGVNQRTSTSDTPLHIAVERKLFEMCQVLLRYGADVNAKLNIASNSENPLMKAAASGDLKIMRLLVENGAVVEQKDRMGRTAVIHACMNGSTNVLSYLLHIGANVERADNSGNTPLHYAAAYGWFFTVKLLLDVGVDPNVGNMWKMTPIVIAYLKGHPGIVRELLNHGKAEINNPDDYGQTMIFHACSSELGQSDLCEQIRYIIEEKGALCTIKDHSEQTPLHRLAVWKSNIHQTPAIAELLLKNGCELNAVDDKGDTAVMLALTKASNFPLATFLLKKRCNLLLPPDGNPTTTILHNIADNIWKDPLALKELTDLFKSQNYIDVIKSMAKYVDHNGYTPLLLAVNAIKKYQVTHYNDPSTRKWVKDSWEAAHKFIRFLIQDLESDINAKVGKRFCELNLEQNSRVTYHDYSSAEKAVVHLALSGNDPAFDESDAVTANFSGRLFKDLVNLGAIVDVYDHGGLTPLALCIEYKHTEVMDFLLSTSKCDFNFPIEVEKAKVNPLFYAVRRQKGSDVISKLIDCGCDINAVLPDNKKTFLHELISFSQTVSREDKQRVVEKLAEKQYDFNKLDCNNNTVLHYAVSGNAGSVNDSCELEVKLLQLGTDAGLGNTDEKTALHYVFYKGDNYNVTTDPVELTKVICRSMTKDQINKKDTSGKTALHYAAIRGATTCCVYLLMIGADVNSKDDDGNTPLTLAIKHKNEGCATSFIQSGANLKAQLFESVAPVPVPVNKSIKVKAVKHGGRNTEGSSDDDLSDDDSSDDEQGDDDTKSPWVWQVVSQVKKRSEPESIPLYQAAIERGLRGVAMFITDAGTDRSGLTEFDAIIIAMKTYKYNVARHLVTTTTDLNVLRQTGDHKQNLLHILALSCEHATNKRDEAPKKVAEALIKAGVPVDAYDEWDCTPLMYAVINRHIALADILAEKIGCYNINYEDGFKRTYLAAAWWRCHSSNMESGWYFIQELLKYSVNLNVPIYLPVNSELASIDQQQKDSDPDIWQSYPENKTSALILAITFGQLLHSRALLKQDANPNMPDGNKITPLMHAIIQNKTDNVKQLLNYTYDPAEEAKKKEEKSQKDNISQDWNKTSMFQFTNSSSPVTTASKEVNKVTLSEENQAIEEHSKGKQEEEFTLVQKTSPVNLNAKDSNGRTALHYVARPLPAGTYDNAEIAFLFAKNGAKMTKDSSGINPYELALMSGATKVAAVLKNHYKLTNKNEKHQLDRDFPVKDKLYDQLTDLPDYKTAAEDVLKHYNTDMETEDKYCHEVNERCNVVNGTLVMDEEQNIFFDVLMTIVDVRRGEWGLYNFYQMQLVFQPSKNLYVLFTRWGRIQDSGQYQHTPFSDKAEAVTEFKKIFKEKTGNNWECVKNFERKPGKYRLVEDAARKAPPPLRDIHFKLKSRCKSVLPKNLYKIVKTLMDPKVMQLSMQSDLRVNVKSLPFGQLHRDRLLQGKEILEQIEKLLAENKEYKSKGSPEEVNKYQENLEKISDLSNDFFHVIPQSGYVYEQIKPLDSKDQLQVQIHIVTNLLDYEVVCKIILAAMHHRKQFNPVDFVYRCLDCKMELMNKNDTMSQMILKYIWTATHKIYPVNVHGIYKLARKGEADRLIATGLENRRLLWHGSKSTNLLSILNRGLLVAPPEARFSGSAYGKGIYFSDSFCKSCSYTTDAAAKFMLLCEVALGNIEYYDSKKKDTEEKDKNIYNSLVVLGTECYSPTSWLILPSGVSIPQGKIPTAGWRDSFSEYVVKDPAQVCLRYLVKFSKQ